MARLLLEKAYELGCKSALGCATAIQAARIRLEQDPADKEHWREKLLSACRIQYQKSNGPDKAQAADALIVELMGVSDAWNDKGDFEEAAKPLAECRQVALAVRSLRLEDIADKLKTLNGKIDARKKFAAYAKKLVEIPRMRRRPRRSCCCASCSWTTPPRRRATPRPPGTRRSRRWSPWP